MNESILSGDYFRLTIMIILPTVIWKSKNCAGFSGKTQLLYAMAFTSSCIFSWFTSFPSETGAKIRSIYALAAWLTVYFVWVKFKDTNIRHEDSFGIKFLTVVVAISAVLFNDGLSINSLKFTYSEVLELRFSYLCINTFLSFGSYLEVVAILPQMYIVYQDKTNKIKNIVLYYIYAMWSNQYFNLLMYYEPTIDK